MSFYSAVTCMSSKMRGSLSGVHTVKQGVTPDPFEQNDAFFAACGFLLSCKTVIMEDIIESLEWGVTTLPVPGAHSTLPEDDIFPWKCLSEITPGLYLACASEVADRVKCTERGISLVVNMCGDSHTSKYSVHEPMSSTKMLPKKFESLASFACELYEYCRTATNAPQEQRKLFTVTIAAEDIPTYAIEQHFLECAMLIEIVIRSRKGHEEAAEEEYYSIPAVAVNCMVGVSRSASIVIAYLMKKYAMTRDDAINFVHCTRPVVQPNPGFQRQLSVWEALRGFRICDEWSARALALEAKAKSEFVNDVCAVLPTILHSSKCSDERRFFGLFLREVDLSEAEMHTIYRELRAVVAADVDSEVYTDIPNYFGYVAEVMCSINSHAPTLLQSSTEFRSALVCNDLFYYRVVKDLARSGFEKDPSDTVRGFCSLFEAVYEKHLNVQGGTPLVLHGGEAEFAMPPDCALSFPFLFLVAPYAEGFVRFSEWGVLTSDFPPMGESFTPCEIENLKRNVLHAFLQFFFQSSCSSVESATSKGYTKLGRLQKDLEVATFQKLKLEVQSSGTILSSLDNVLAISIVANEHVMFLMLCKTISGIVAFRILLESAEMFLSQTYSTRLSEGVVLAQELLPLSAISAAVATLETMFETHYKRPSRVCDFFRSELVSLLDARVLNPAGVVSLFQWTT